MSKLKIAHSVNIPEPMSGNLEKKFANYLNNKWVWEKSPTFISHGFLLIHQNIQEKPGVVVLRAQVRAQDTDSFLVKIKSKKAATITEKNFNWNRDKD